MVIDKWNVNKKNFLLTRGLNSGSENNSVCNKKKIGKKKNTW